MSDEITQSAAATCDGPIFSGLSVGGYIVTENVLYFCRDVITVPKGTKLRPGDFVSMTNELATDPATIRGISYGFVDACDGPLDIVITARDTEVADSRLIYGDMDPAAVNARLAADPRHIIVRGAKLPNTGQFGMGTPGIPVGDPAAGIPYPDGWPGGSGGSGGGGSGTFKHPAYYGELTSSSQVPDETFIEGLPTRMNPAAGQTLTVPGTQGTFGAVFALPAPLTAASIINNPSGLNVTTGFTEITPPLELTDTSPGAAPGATVTYNVYYSSQALQTPPPGDTGHTLTIG